MRLRTCLLGIAILSMLGVWAGCGSSSNGSGGNGDAGSSDGGTDALSDAIDELTIVEPGDAAHDGSDAAASITVTGHVVYEQYPGYDAIGANANVTIVDASGRRFDAIADANGAFSVTGVAPPYDAYVPANLGGNVFLGLSTPRPRFEVTTQDLHLKQHTAKIHYTLAPPAGCTDQCPFTLMPYDTANVVQVSGGTAGGFSQGNTFTYDGDVTWIGADSLSLAFQVLVADSGYQHFWTTSGSVGTVNDGATSTANLASPAPVSTLGSFTVSVSTIGLSPSLGTPNVSIYLQYPNSRAIGYLPQAQSTSLVTGIPNILGATLYANASVNAGDQSSASSAVALPLSTSSASLTLHAPPSVQSPAVGGSLSLAHGEVSWTTATTKNVASVGYLILNDGGAPVRGPIVMTADNNVRMDRLTRLGASMNAGANVRITISLVGQVASLDAMVDESLLAQPDHSQFTTTHVNATLAP